MKGCRKRKIARLSLLQQFLRYVGVEAYKSSARKEIKSSGDKIQFDKSKNIYLSGLAVMIAMLFLIVIALVMRTWLNRSRKNNRTGKKKDEKPNYLTNSDKP